MRISRAVYWTSALAVVAFLVTASWLAYYTDLEVLLRFANDPYLPTVQSLSRNMIYAIRLNPDDVRDLNHDAGAYSAVNFRDKAEAEKMLKFFISRGVDIDSMSGLSRSTALHLAVAANESAAVTLLLRHGAQTDLKNGDGLTPLELARSLQTKNPQDDYSKILNLLNAGQ